MVAERGVVGLAWMEFWASSGNFLDRELDFRLGTLNVVRLRARDITFSGVKGMHVWICCFYEFSDSLCYEAGSQIGNRAEC